MNNNKNHHDFQLYLQSENKHAILFVIFLSLRKRNTKKHVIILFNEY